MTTPAQGNLSGSASKRPDAAFEASGLSPDEAERFAAAFRPSWEFDEAPFTPLAAPPVQAAGQGFEQGSGSPRLAEQDHAQLEALSAENVQRDNLDARMVAPRAPPPRVETNEPEVSVIIDRSIIAAEMEAQRPAPAPPSARPQASVAEPPFTPPAFAPGFAPAFAAPAQAPAVAPVPSQRRVAPVMRGRADDSLELPAALKKSNKGLFIGVGVAVAAAALVLSLHGIMSSSSEAATPPPETTTAAPAPSPVAETAAHTAAAPIPPPPVTPVATTPPPPAAVTAQAPVAAATPVTPPPRNFAPAPRAPAPRPAPPPPVHHAAPRNPPKASGGGIVRDNPF